MCLSTVYAVVNGNQNKVCEYVCNIKLSGKEITLTDIMGTETKVNGTITSMDFVKNQVLIESED